MTGPYSKCAQDTQALVLSCIELIELNTCFLLGDNEFFFFFSKHLIFPHLTLTPI